ncbi:MAG TPA: hypothetical protein VM554_07800 [Acidisarcina sp.]|nr:hypothetical protein [Acidisarcina sp.]
MKQAKTPTRCSGVTRMTSPLPGDGVPSHNRASLQNADCVYQIAIVAAALLVLMSV